MANAKVIAGLQTIVTDLAQQADGHAIQSKISASSHTLVTVTFVVSGS